MNKRARVKGIGHPAPTRRVVRIAMLGLVVSLLGPIPTGPGAEAASFYTRKRVNGVWVKGKFAKDGGRSYRRSLRIARAPLDRAIVEADAMPLPPSAAEEGLRRDAVRGDGPETTAALPRVVAGLADPFPEPVVADERLARLKAALTAHATVLVARADDPQAAKPTPFGLVGTAAAAPAVPEASVALSVPAPGAAALGSRASLAPRSVSYDFETGIKTTVFENSVVREPFDVAAMKAVTPRAPGR